MADIAYSNVTFTVVKARKTGGTGSRREVEATIAFGNNSLTYPTGGVPITGATHLGVTEKTRACRALGFPEELEDLVIVDQSANGAGYKFEWDRTNNKIKAMVDPQAVAADKPMIEHGNTTFVPNPATLRVIARGQ